MLVQRAVRRFNISSQTYRATRRSYLQSQPRCCSVCDSHSLDSPPTQKSDPSSDSTTSKNHVKERQKEKDGLLPKDASKRIVKSRASHDLKSTPSPPADHRQLAIDQELFTTSLYSPGSPLFLPNGTRMFNRLTNYLRAQYTTYGFDEVLTPTIYKKSLWEKSGHWENYKEDMFSVTGRGAKDTTLLSEEGGKQAAEDEEFGLKPMNCPGHCLLFASKQRSFRDLPIRYADFSPLHRNEISGALSGLTRVRRFHQDDGHIFCRPSQVFDEISQTLHFIKTTYQTFNLGPYRLALSTRPETDYIGELEDWDRAENALREALDKSGQPWTINPGDGAFYGPKIDIILKDSDGKEHQAATIQLDFQLPNRFDLKYNAPAPEFEQKGEITTDPGLLATQGDVRPVMVHRAVLGSVERFMALLIEHYNGKYPFWLNPRQVSIVTVTDAPEVVKHAHLIKDTIQESSRSSNAMYGIDGSNNVTEIKDANFAPKHAAFAIDVDDSPRSVAKKVSEAKRNHTGIIIVVGKQDVANPGGLLTIDMSAIPLDARGIFRYLFMQRLIPGANEAHPDKRTMVLGEKSNDLRDKRQTQDMGVFDLRNVKSSVTILREFMRELERAYV